MATIHDLPTELLLLIAEHITNLADESLAALSCLTRTSRSFREQLLPTLFAHNAKHGCSSALRYGAVVGDTAIISLALANGADVEASVDQFQNLPPPAREKLESFRTRFRDDDTRHCLSPLSCACLYGHLDAARLLVETGRADLESVDIMNRTPLFKAVKSGRVDLVNFLLDGGAQLCRQDADNETALWPAIRWNRTEVVELLLSRDQAIRLDHATATPRPRISALSLAASMTEDRTVIMESLLRHGADLSAREENGYQALDFAALEGCLENLRALLRHGADVNSTNAGRTWTPLGTAARQDRADVLELLVEHGADVEAKDPHHGRTPLVVVAWNPDALASVQVLVEKGHANVNSADDSGRTALSVAALNDNTAIMRYLLEHTDADVDAVDDGGMTPLTLLLMHKASSKTVVENVELLLSHGARADGCPASAGKRATPLAWLARSARGIYASGEMPPVRRVLELTRMLVMAGADIKARDEGGKTPLESTSLAALKEYMLRVAAEAAGTDKSKS